MSRVAVAGVTGGVGYAIVAALLDQPNTHVVLLSRQSSPLSSLTHFTSRGATLHQVDYSSEGQLVYALTGVDTVISTIFSYPDITPTINLIRASQKAGVRRFAPSEFAFTCIANSNIGLYEPKRRIRTELQSSGLEYTAFQTGIFMDYFAFGAPKKYKRPFKLFPFIVDISRRIADVPGTGEEAVSFTSLRDIGRLIAAAIQLQEPWPEELDMRSETTTYNQVIRDAEAVIGQEITVKYIGKKEIRFGLVDDGRDEMRVSYGQALSLIADGLGSVPPVLNQLVPDVRTTTVKEFVTRYWGE